MLIEAVAVQNLLNGTILASIWKSNKNAQRRENLLRWKLGPKPMPLVDRMLEKKFVPKKATSADRKKARRIAGMLRSIVNTKAFDLLVLAGLTNNRKFDRMFGKTKKIAGWVPGLNLPGAK